jgi:hypothetical protein
MPRPASVGAEMKLKDPQGYLRIDKLLILQYK